MLSEEQRIIIRRVCEGGLMRDEPDKKAAKLAFRDFFSVCRILSAVGQAKFNHPLKLDYKKRFDIDLIFIKCDTPILSGSLMAIDYLVGNASILSYEEGKKDGFESGYAYGRQTERAKIEHENMPDVPRRPEYFENKGLDG